MSTKQLDVTEMVFHRYLANHQTVVFVTDEAFRVQTQVQEAAKRLKAERGETVHVYMHDKFCGFYDSTPTLIIPTDKSNVATVALQMMMLDEKGIKSAIKPPPGQLPFDPKLDMIFVLKDWDYELRESPLLVQGLRDAIQSNMGSTQFHYDEATEETTRGKRLLVFITTTDKIPLTLPELKPHIVPLPDDKIIGEAIDNVLEPLIEANKADKKKGLAKPDSGTRLTLVTSLKGSTYEFAENTISYALAKHRGLGDMRGVLSTIEQERATYIAGVPGLMHIPQHTLTPVDQLVGFEPAVQFVRDRIGIDPDEAAKRKVQPLRGLTLAGAPGTGKTQFAMAVAQEAKRILLLWNLGESQGSLVGESEANTRRAVQIAQAMGAVVLLDDVDKAGVKVASGGSEASIEGGPFGRMIQMLLTEMSSNENQAIWLFTANRVNNLPPELIRPGRMDERFFVVRPDETARARIIRVHILKRNYEINSADEKMIDLMSDTNVTEGFTGAELEDVVKKGVVRAMVAKSNKLDFNFMIKTAKGTTPMIKQRAYGDDIKQMEEFCETWERCGVIGEKATEQVAGSTRAKKSTSI